MSYGKFKSLHSGLRPLSAAIGAVLLTGAAVPSMAQNESTRMMLEEVIVTAQKREQSVNDIPMSITAFSGDSMAEMGIEDTADLAAIVPGFAYSDSVLGTPVYTMRGVGFNETSAQASSTVGVYLDEIGVAYPIMTRGVMLDVQRVEVLKGPQGTLYGRNSTGGAVNYIANKPTEEFESAISMTYGRFDALTLDGFVSGAVTDNLQARLAVKTVNSGEGWQKSVSRDDELGEQDKLSLRLSLAAQLGDNTDAAFSVAYWEDNSDSLAPQFVKATYPSRIGPAADIINQYAPDGPLGNDAQKADWTAGAGQQVNMESTSLSLQITHAINDSLTFKSLTGYAKFDDTDSFYERSGIQGIPASVVPDGFKSGDITGRNTGLLVSDAYIQNTDIEAWTQEFRLSGETEAVSWLAGIYYSENEVDNRATQVMEMNQAVSYAPLPVYNFDRFDNTTYQETSTLAVYASADWTLGENMVVTTGLRYTEDETDYAGCSQDTNGSLATFYRTAIGQFTNAQQGECVTLNASLQSALVEDELNEDSLSFRVVANYALTDDVSAYASYTRGFKSGSFPTLGATSFSQVKPVVQEQLDSIELGFKATLADGAAQLNGAIYNYDYTDKQLLTKIPDAIFGTLWTLQNIPDSEVMGAELDLQWIPAQGLTIGAGISYLESEVSGFVGSNQKGERVDFDGSEFPFSANLQLSATAKYEWDISDAISGNVAIDLSHTDDSRADFTGKGSTQLGTAIPYAFDKDFVIEGYTIANARMGVTDSTNQWGASIWVRNLTDEFYITNTIQHGDMVSRYAGMPRTYGVTVNYSF